MKDPKHNDSTRSAEGYSGGNVIYRDGAINALDVQRAADALLRQGTKPSVAALREQLGGGSPNTLTPMLARYWEALGQRLATGPEALERVPESLARVTELLWRRALEEARERLKILQDGNSSGNELSALQEQVLKLSVAVAESGAREGEQLTHLAALSKEREGWRSERANLLAMLKSTQALLEQQSARVAILEKERSRALEVPANSKRPMRPRKTAKQPLAAARKRVSRPRRKRKPLR
jgi:Plasmid replication region DNA-binding N-term